MADGDATAIIDGIAAAVVTVADLDAHLRLYRDALGWDVTAQVTVHEPQARQLWGTPAATITVLAPARAQTGRLHLFSAAGPPPEPGPHPQGDGLGLYAVDMYVRDLDDARRRCEAAGATFAGGPAAWELGTPERRVTVAQARIAAPEGVNLVFVVPGAPRPTAAWDADPQAYATELTSVVIASPDVDASIAFWGGDGLGLAIAYDARFTQPALSQLVGAADDQEFRMAFGVGPRTARLELLGRPDGRGRAATPAGDLRARQRPGAITGMSALGVRVRDLGAALEMVRRRGGAVVAGPVALADSPYGGERLAVARTPDGIVLELAD
jgi:catechol 2,3-dioxygenase-like lactoylglutathione lyase family enzyme